MGFFGRGRKRRSRVDEFYGENAEEPEPEDAVSEPGIIAAQPHRVFDLLQRASGSVNDPGQGYWGVSERVRLGPIGFPSGEIVCCDPLTGTEGFTYPTTEGAVHDVAALGLHVDGRFWIAALGLTLAEGEPISWELLTPDGLVEFDPAAADIPGYTVDAGVGCFTDPKALRALQAASARFYEQRGPLTGHEPLVDDLENDGTPLTHLVYRPTAELAMAVATSGWGDGIYSTWLASDSAGHPVQLLTSFDTLSDQMVVTDPPTT